MDLLLDATLLRNVQVRDKQAMVHLKAQLAQAQAGRGHGVGKAWGKGVSDGISRKAQAHVYVAMDKCLHLDKELER